MGKYRYGDFVRFSTYRIGKVIGIHLNGLVVEEQSTGERIKLFHGVHHFEPLNKEGTANA